MTKQAEIEVTFTNLGKTDPDTLVALLTERGFEGFDESETGILKSYIGIETFRKEDIEELAQQFYLTYTWREIEPQNWNAVWESNFEPVIIDDFAAIRADFHQPIPNVAHEIVITPKMSFGTGHHATTTMMIEQMRDLSFTGKTVFDFGTGTGILAILAEKLGALKIEAIDNDVWSIENSWENVERNKCNNITVRLAENAASELFYDVILANINRNVILENLSFLYSQLQKSGYLLLSGLLREDETDILEKTKEYGLTHLNTRHRSQWISLLFSR